MAILLHLPYYSIQVYKKLLWYSTEDFPQKEWTRKDSFTFTVSKNGSSRSVEQEFRFRISSTFAVADDSSVVATMPLSVSQGTGVPFE